MKEVKIEKCPYCGGEELIESNVSCMVSGVCVATNSTARRSILFATVCRQCGSVVRTYCKDPENLLPKKERRE